MSITSWYRIRQHAEMQGFAVQTHLGDDNAGVHRLLDAGHVQDEPQVYDGDHTAPQIDHTPQEYRHARHAGEVNVVDNLAHFDDLDRESLFCKRERQVLVCLDDIANLVHSVSPIG